MRTTNVYNKDKTLSFSIFLFFFIQSFNGSIKLLFDIPDNYHSLVTNLFGGIYILYFIIKVLPIVYKKSIKTLLTSYLIFAFLYSISILLVTLRGEKIDWLISQNAIWTFAFWIPVGVSAFSIINYKTLYEVLLKYSYILTFIFGVVFIKSLLYISSKQTGFYNMFFSYSLLIPTILHLSYYFFSKKKLILLIFLLELTMILMIGSRGPLISVIAFIFIKFLTLNKSLSSKIATSILTGLFLIFFYSSFVDINTFLIDNYGISSRTLSKFSNRELDVSSQLSGRDISWKAALELIEEKSFVGYGIGGDFYPMIELTGILSDTGSGIDSAHNGFLELMLYFGIPIGLFFGLWLVFSIIKIRNNYSFQHRELLMITFAVFVLPAMTVGGGVFTKPGIALYIYMILRYKPINYFNKTKSIEYEE